MTSISVQEYLQAIYRLQTGHALVSTTNLSAYLDVKPASVTGMIQKLQRQGLVKHKPYQGVTLTPKGAKEALRLIRIHRLWELFLNKVLDVPWNEVHEEAHQLEHATSDRLANRLAEFLEHPQIDPHGHLIPSREGVLPTRDSFPLSQASEGQIVMLAEVPDGDSELLRYLSDLALYPGTEIQVLTLAPLDGPLTIQQGEAKQILGRGVAAQILVTCVDDKTNTRE
jgi:DtxR family Mn-dependent transcriptional regulator